MNVQRSATVVLFAAVASNAAHAQCVDFQPGWGAWGIAEIPFVGAEVTAMVEFDDGTGPALYAGGTFRIAGESAAGDIAKWDGAHWLALPFPSGHEFEFGSSNASAAHVYELAVFDDGSGPALAVSGVFTSVDAVAANGIARWNGTAWSAMPGLADAQGLYVVPRLEIYDDGSGPALYGAGGFIDEVGGAPADGLARWNGSTWQAIDGAGDCTYVQDLFAFDDGSGAGPSLFLAGVTTPGTSSSTSVVRWNGSAFTTIGVVSGPNPPFAGVLGSFDDGSGPALYLGGNFTSVDGVAATSIAKWNGSSWSAVGSPLDVPNDFAVFDDGGGPALFAAFDWGTLSGPSIAKWNGSSWVGFAGATDGDCDDLFVYDDGSGVALWAGGPFRHTSASRADGVARWRAGAWETLATSRGRFGHVDAATVFDDGGGPKLYSDTRTSVGDVIERLDVSGWTQIGGATSGDVAAFAVYAGELYAGGEFETLGGVVVNGLARWNGASWATVGGGLSEYNSRVYDFAVHDFGAGAELVACGAFHHVGGVEAKRIAKWNGSSWSPLGEGFGATAWCAASYDDGNGAKLYAGGGFNVSGSVVVGRVARWNGAAWEALGTGADSRVRDLAVFDDGGGPQLYACGDFSTAGGQAAPFIARWNGVAWSALPATGPNGPLEHLAAFDAGSGSKLYAAGAFSQISAAPLELVASFDGSSWSALGLGVDAEVSGFGVFDRPSGPDSLFLAGSFTRAGGRASMYMAEWKASFGCAPASYCTAGTTSNGCNAHIAATGTPSASASSGFVLDVSDVEGAKTGLIFYGIDGRLGAHWGTTSSYLCIKAPVQRTTVSSSGGTSGACDGSISIDWNAWIAAHPGALGTPFAAGQAVQAQCWFRDPPNAKTTSLSDAIEFYVAP